MPFLWYNLSLTCPFLYYALSLTCPFLYYALSLVCPFFNPKPFISNVLAKSLRMCIMLHKTKFCFSKYIERLVQENVLAKERGVGFARCGGWQDLDALVERTRAARGVVALSDVTEERTVHRGGTWHQRRVFTLFVLMRYDVRQGGFAAATAEEEGARWSDLPTLAEALDTVRELVRQLLARFIYDYERNYADMAYVDVYDVHSRELGATVLQGATGTALQIAMEKPVDLTFDEALWKEEKE